MSARKFVQLGLLACGVSLATAAHSFFFFIPIPNLSKPPALEKIIDALEKSNETKAIAYASEDKTFGSKQWVWGSYSGQSTQEDADRIALAKCTASLVNSKNAKAGNQPIYDFGKKVCELHAFANKTLMLPPPPQPPAVIATPTPVAAEPVAPVASSPPPAVAAPTSPATQVTQVQNSTSETLGRESTTAKRLRELNELLKDGLITEFEHSVKKKAILDSI